MNKDQLVPEWLSNKVKQYMDECGYSKGTVKMKLGNLNFLFKLYGEEQMLTLLKSTPNCVSESVKYIETTLPKGCIVSSDVHSFKLAWESLNGIEIIKKRVVK